MTPTVLMGFASFKDGSFELIVRDDESGVETTLHGTLKPGQLQLVDRILPTCVFVPVRAHEQAAPKKEAFVSSTLNPLTGLPDTFEK